ncbi:MAG: SdpI family protein [Verrucomicrobiae bacterium]|nr:SdpI family protein [Verrucomicrobiae bacterium]
MDSSSQRPRFRLAWVISGLWLILLCGVNAWALSKLPGNARVPIHWNVSGEIDGWAGRTSLWIMPGTLVGITLLLAFLPRIEPRRENLIQSAGAYQAVWIGAVTLFSLLHLAIISSALGHKVPMNLWAGLTVGLLFVVIGRVLGKVKSNYLMGIRTPWTLSSEYSWEVTHRLGGRLMMAFGVALATLALLDLPGWWLWGGMVGGLFLIIGATFVVSYRAWKHDPSRSSRE